MQKLRSSMIAFLSTTISLLMALSPQDCAHAADVTIDASVEYQVIDGWGITHYIEWLWEGPLRYPIPEQDVMFQIKNDLCIDYVQIYDHTFNIFMEETNDDGDPYHFNWASYDSQFGNHAVTFERMKDMEIAGLTFAPTPFVQPAWLCDSNGNFDSTIPNVYDELGEYWAAFCIYARNNYGLAIPYVILQNEPDWLRCTWTAQEQRDGIKAVGTRLRAEGFSTMIIAPDNASAANAQAMCQTILPDSIARGYINSIAYHPYDGFSGRDGPDMAIPAMTNLANDSVVNNSGLSPWMTEWAFFLAYGDKMRDWVNTLRLALDFAKMVYNTHVYGNTSLYVIWSSGYDWDSDLDSNGVIENEGIFGPGVTGGKLDLKKYGHVLSQYTIYVPPGSKRIDATLSGASNIFVTAYLDSATGRFTIEFINKEPDSHVVNVNINNIQNISKLDVIRTSDTENSAQLDSVLVIGNFFSHTLAGSSMTTLTGIISPVGLHESRGLVPDGVPLSAFPSPFHHRIALKYVLPEESWVTLVVFDMAGRKVRTLVDKTESAGQKQFYWDGRDASGRTLSSGVYFCKLDYGGFQASSKVLLIR